jgi:spore maturation protein CgeB
MSLGIVVFGLSITSSWGNGHASTYRALVKALAARGHRVTFLERDVPWYRRHRDLHDPDYCKVELYSGLPEVGRRFTELVADADLAVLGSYVPDGIAIGDWLTRTARGATAFYDIDTPVTLAGLAGDGIEYVSAALIPRFDLYLSFTGGPALRVIEEQYGSPRARPLYCAADLDLHAPAEAVAQWDLGYLGTYSTDRHPTLERLLIEPARRLPEARFVIAGAQYPADVAWPGNVAHVEHVPPAAHAAFYGAQRYTLNVTRAAMVRLGFSPSVRLFEAAACGVPIVSDRWPGLETLFTPGEEILIADEAEDVLAILTEMPEERRRAVAAAARKRLFRSHTAEHRAKDLETYCREVLAARPTDAREIVA